MCTILNFCAVVFKSHMELNKYPVNNIFRKNKFYASKGAPQNSNKSHHHKMRTRPKVCFSYEDDSYDKMCNDWKMTIS